MTDYKDSLLKFLETPTPFRKIIVIYGPTASGKTSLAIEVGKYLQENGYYPEIISVDSRQIYKGLDIGTGKITKEEMGEIPHHMIDIIKPSKKYSMIDFRRDFDALPLWKNTNIIPILCGGTGLYIDAVLYDMDFPENPPDWSYREELENIRKEKGNEYLWNLLFEIDPEYARELSPSNYRYIIRGLEVIRDTGKSKKESHNTKKFRYSPFFLTPYRDSEENRKILYQNINDRVEKMFNNGLIEETNYNIITYGAHSPGLETIGYKEVVAFLEGKMTQEETLSLVQQHSRNYAKRQITWNKKYNLLELGI